MVVVRRFNRFDEKNYNLPFSFSKLDFSDDPRKLVISVCHSDGLYWKKPSKFSRSKECNYSEVRLAKKKQLGSDILRLAKEKLKVITNLYLTVFLIWQASPTADEFRGVSTTFIPLLPHNYLDRVND